MSFKKISIACFALSIMLFAPLSSAQAGAKCTDRVFLEVTAAVESLISQKVDEIAAGNCLKIPELWSLYARGMAAIDEAGAQAGCTKTGGDTTRSKIEADVAKMCPPKTKKPPVKPKAVCRTPPSPATVRTEPAYACFTAINTNSDDRCVYSFTYTGVTGKPQNGGSVGAGKSSSPVCSLVEGVDVKFKKWTLSGAKAQ